MKVKTFELTGAALDWAVANIEGDFTESNKQTKEENALRFLEHYKDLNYSTSWAQGGPIIEREGMRLCVGSDGTWDAELCEFDILEQGPTPLIAAMRCYVASKLGDTVEIPEGLL